LARPCRPQGGELQSAFSTFQTFDGAGQGGGDGDNVELLEENAELRASLEEALAELREYKSRLERQQSMLEASQKEEETTFDRLQVRRRRAPRFYLCGPQPCCCTAGRFLAEAGQRAGVGRYAGVPMFPLGAQACRRPV